MFRNKIKEWGKKRRTRMTPKHPFSVMVWGALLAAAGHDLKWTPDQ